MNVFCGIVHMDGMPIDPEIFSRCEFESPHWKPDHKSILFREGAAFASTQRFVTPESKRERMPYVHPERGIVVVADSYLTHKDDSSPDCEVIASAYLKWGEDCPKYLFGNFSFAIWDPGKRKAFLATDRTASRPCFYSFEKNRRLIFANTVAPFRILCSRLTIDHRVLSNFTLDLFDSASTCYAEVSALAPAHRAVFHRAKSARSQFWDLREQRRRLPYQKREEFYEAFRELFMNSVRSYSRTSFALMAHLSGGLDSSSVASAAATLLAQEEKTLYGFTAIPRDLEGPSHRSGWIFHEMPRIEKAFGMYPNLRHLVFRTATDADPFEELRPIYPLIDRPFRNVFNYHWMLGAFKQAAKVQSRSILTGQAGNATISWRGRTWKGQVRDWLKAVPLWLRPQRGFGSYYQSLNRSFVRRRATRKAMRRRVIVLDPQFFMMSRSVNSALPWAMRAASLWFGVEMLDPTADTRILEFCYSAPQWVHYKGRGILEKRLLVREALAGIVPEEIRLNPDRGEQAADWYLQYNSHIDRWRREFDRIASPQSSLWDWYDKIAVDSLFGHYVNIEKGSRLVTTQVGGFLTRCLSLSFFMDYLDQHALKA